MKSTFIFSLLCFIFLHVAHAQDTYSTDSLRLAQTIEWLENKLTYNYYNTDDQEWWINRFAYNQENQTITIKNIASPQLQSISDKTYLQLHFKLEDLNPYTISIEKTVTNAGRLVIGKTIRVGAYHHDKAITKTRNGQIASHISFLYLAIPQYFEDSVSTYTENIVEKLQLAIQLATRVYARPDMDWQINRLTARLNDLFSSETQNWHIQTLFPGQQEITVTDRSGSLIGKYFLRFTQSGVEWTSLKPNEPALVSLLRKSSENQLIFQDDTHTLSFRNMNEFTYTEQGQTQLLIRSWSETSLH